MNADDYIASVGATAGLFAPRNTALCLGQTLPLMQNVALFSLVGTDFGGDGYQNFQLPDLQGAVPFGTGTSASGAPAGAGRVRPDHDGPDDHRLDRHRAPLGDRAVRLVAAAPRRLLIRTGRGPQIPATPSSHIPTTPISTVAKAVRALPPRRAPGIRSRVAKYSSVPAKKPA